MNRLLSRRRLAGVVLAALVLALSVVCLRPGPARSANEARSVPDKAAVDRARSTVQMLDDIYKSAVVNITQTYVKAQERTPAARAAKAIFKDMEAKGWHSARLIDATGEPANKKNVAVADFEKRAVAELKAGQPYVEEVGYKNDKPVLRAATPVPAVMKQCIACHPGNKEGDLLGAIVYELPIK